VKKISCALLLVTLCAQAAADQATPSLGQPLLIDQRGRLVALDDVGKRIYYLRSSTLELLESRQLRGRPAFAVERSDGALLVTLRDRGEVLVIDGKDERAIPVGPDPRGIALSSDESKMWVVVAGANRLAAFDLESGREVARRDIPPLARAVGVQGRRIAIGHLDQNRTDLELDQVTTSLAGGTLFVGDAGLSSVGNAPPDVYYGEREVTPLAPPRVLLGDGRAAVLPWAAAYRDGMLAVGDDALRTVTVRMEGGALYQETAPDGVRGLVFGPEGTLLALASFAPRIYRYRITERSLAHVSTALLPVPREERALLAKIDRGRRLFHDATDPRISTQGVACASCHPDGLSDGKLWRVDGTARRTPTLAERVLNSAPYRWDGARASLHDSMNTTITRLGGSGLPDEDLSALEAYMGSMTLPARDQRPSNLLVAEGKRVFEAALCSGCHIPDKGYRDGKLHDVGTSIGRLDTPSLLGLRMGGPYFHDGAAKTLMEVVLLANQGGRHMGDTKDLTKNQRTALVAFLETL